MEGSLQTCPVRGAPDKGLRASGGRGRSGQSISGPSSSSFSKSISTVLSRAAPPCLGEGVVQWAGAEMELREPGLR